MARSKTNVAEMGSLDNAVVPTAQAVETVEVAIPGVTLPGAASDSNGLLRPPQSKRKAATVAFPNEQRDASRTFWRDKGMGESYKRLFLAGLPEGAARDDWSTWYDKASWAQVFTTSASLPEPHRQRCLDAASAMLTAFAERFPVVGEAAKSAAAAIKGGDAKSASAFLNGLY